MFAVRGIAVSFSVFVIVYCATSLVLVCGWRRVYRRLPNLPVQRLANILFGLRIFPLLLAALITIAFTIPSFLLLEPRSVVEPLGDIPLVLALFGSLLAAYGLINAVMAAVKASQTVSSWSSSAERVSCSLPFPVLRITRSIPALTAAGILRPKILLSGSAEFLLNENELHTALNHELAHIRRRDNFRKLMLRFVVFPGMRPLEGAWLQASEMSADDAAVSSTADALDLAAALLKLSTLKQTEPSPELTAALVHGHASVINARVERLISWSDARQGLQDFSVSSVLGVVLPAIAVFVFTYTTLLTDLHKVTEWLVR